VKFQTLKLLIFSLSFALIGGTAGYKLGRSGFLVELSKTASPIKLVNQTLGTQTIDFTTFWQAWDLLNKDYYKRPIPVQKMLYGAISGLYQSVGDPYTVFLDPDQNKVMNSTLEGQYEGVGVELGMKENQLLVVAPLDGSPAQASGIKSGDKILEINGQTTSGVTITDAVTKIRGQSGSVVDFKLQRDDQAPFDLKVTRGQITVKSVKWEQKSSDTAYIRISRFGESTPKEWDEAAAQIDYQLPRLANVILDLRGNPGGYTNAAVYVAGEFLKDGVVFYEENNAEIRTPFNIEPDRNGKWLGKKVIILIDSGSASSSEILAGALLDRASAVTVGVKSFGKGVVQTVADLPEGAAVHITVAKWLTPSGTWVQDSGITPKYEVAISEQDVASGRDPQLDKALELTK